MSDQTPKASGPLWESLASPGEPLNPHCVSHTRWNADDQPCRLIPGHGKVVPLALVEAIAKAAEPLMTLLLCEDESCAACQAVRAAEEADRWLDERRDREMTADCDALWSAERLAAEEAAWRKDGWR